MNDPTETPAVATGVSQSTTATPAVVKPVGPDFCLVQLTAAGVTAAGEGTVRYSNGRTSYVFLPGKPVKVARYEWDLALGGHGMPNGDVLFELVPAPAASITSASEEKK